MNAACPPQEDKAADAFGRLPQSRPEYYPGTNRQIVAPAISVPAAAEAPPDPDRWDAHPRDYTVNGKVVQMFPIGALAKALGRETVTIRRWEAEGIIPVSLWRHSSESSYGKVRLYSRELIEGIAEIARDEGVLTRGRPINSTRFKERVYDLFVQVSKAERAAARGSQAA